VKTYLDIGEIERLEIAATCPRDRLLVRVLSRLGCRVSEALALRVRDIDFVRGEIIIIHLKSRIKCCCPQCNAGLSRSYAFCPRCGITVVQAVSKEQEHRRMRNLPVDSDTLDMLRTFVSGSGMACSHRENSLIFGINRHRAWQIVRECGQRAGLGQLINPESGRLRGVSPHRLRDAFAVHAVKTDDSGDGLRLLQEHLGHTSFDTTARYRKVSGQEHKVWYQKLWERN